MKIKFIACISGALLLFSACEKDVPASKIVSSNLDGEWQMRHMDDGQLFLDSLTLAGMGFMCNLVIDDDGRITVHEGQTKESERAVWKIVALEGTSLAADGLSITLKMLSPEKLKYTYTYDVNNVSGNIFMCRFSPQVEENPFVFFNHRNLGSGLPGAFVFSKKK